MWQLLWIELSYQKNKLLLFLGVWITISYYIGKSLDATSHWHLIASTLATLSVILSYQFASFTYDVDAKENRLNLWRHLPVEPWKLAAFRQMPLLIFQFFMTVVTLFFFAIYQDNSAMVIINLNMVVIIYCLYINLIGGWFGPNMRWAATFLPVLAYLILGTYMPEEVDRTTRVFVDYFDFTWFFFLEVLICGLLLYSLIRNGKNRFLRMP